MPTRLVELMHNPVVWLGAVVVVGLVLLLVVFTDSVGRAVREDIILNTEMPEE